MILNEFDLANKNSINAFIDDMSQYYVGRASSILLSKIKVKYYDKMISIDMCAAITIPSQDILIIKPYESKMVKEIEKAIHAANIGLTPMADAEVVKIYLPKRTREDNIKIFNLIKVRAEKAKVAIRQNRKRARDKIKHLSKNKKFDIEFEIQDKTNKAILEVINLLNNKKKQMGL
jgi:ribosome recycling factor